METGRDYDSWLSSEDVFSTEKEEGSGDRSKQCRTFDPPHKGIVLRDTREYHQHTDANEEKYDDCNGAQKAQFKQKGFEKSFHAFTEFEFLVGSSRPNGSHELKEQPPRRDSSMELLPFQTLTKGINICMVKAGETLSGE